MYNFVEVDSKQPDKHRSCNKVANMFWIMFWQITDIVQATPDNGSHFGRFFNLRINAFVARGSNIVKIIPLQDNFLLGYL